MKYLNRDYTKHISFKDLAAPGSRAARFDPSFDSLPDEDLAAKAAVGSSDHFEALVRRYSAAIYRFSYRISGGAQEAEDIVQETFIKLFAALPNANPELPFKPWLYKIALNTAISKKRKNKDGGRVPLEYAEAMVAGGDAVESTAERLDAQAAIDRLPADYRAMIVLRAVEDLAFAEIAKVLEIPEATARTRFNRAKNALRSSLDRGAS